MKEHSLLRTLLFVLAIMLSASLTPTFARTQSATTRQFVVSENGRSIATVVTEVSGDVQRVAIFRHNQPVHLYSSFPSVSAGSVLIGRAKIFAFYANANKIETTTGSFIAKASERQGRGDVNVIQQRLAADMRILRAVRVDEPSVELQEVLFVIATGNDNVLQGNPSSSLQVVEQPQRSVAARGIPSRVILASLATRAGAVAQGPPADSLEGCVGGCRENREMCVRDSSVKDKTPCYSGYYTCQQGCYSTYHAPLEPPPPPQ